MLPTQTSSFTASDHRNVTVVGREKITQARRTAEQQYVNYEWPAVVTYEAMISKLLIISLLA
jgi:hypothetical protein